MMHEIKFPCGHKKVIEVNLIDYLAYREVRFGLECLKCKYKKRKKDV